MMFGATTEILTFQHKLPTHTLLFTLDFLTTDTVLESCLAQRTCQVPRKQRQRVSVSPHRPASPKIVHLIGLLSKRIDQFIFTVVWAQRSSKFDEERNYILLTIAAPDIPPKSLKVDLKPTSLTFTGHSETKKTTYHVELVFYEEIDPEKSQTHHTSRDVIFKLRKKEMKEEYWPRLLKDSKKMHFLRTDFDKVSTKDCLEATSKQVKWLYIYADNLCPVGRRR